jgi:uncharacterized protein (TIGR00290 family)
VPRRVQGTREEVRTLRSAVAWSGGKDAAVALGETEHDVAALLTTFGENGRSSMHGVRRELIEAQARAVGVPLVAVELPDEPSNDEYEAQMRDALDGLADENIEAVVFGDIFLEDVRAYREETTPDGFETDFPLWGRDTDELASEAAARYDAVTVCVDNSALGREYVGRAFDADFLADLPEATDPCGENGEFHTFVADAPFFDSRVEHEKGEVVERGLGDTKYVYQDLVTEG